MRIQKCSWATCHLMETVNVLTELLKNCILKRNTKKGLEENKFKL